MQTCVLYEVTNNCVAVAVVLFEGGQRQVHQGQGWGEEFYRKD